MESSSAVRIIRWVGGTNPTLSNITRQMRAEGLRPYAWENTPNYRYAVRSHGYTKIMYVVEGVVEIVLPDSTPSRLRLRGGDRIEIPAGIRHGVHVGKDGAKCIEAAATVSKTRPV